LKVRPSGWASLLPGDTLTQRLRSDQG